MGHVYYNSTEERPQIAAAGWDENIIQEDLFHFVYLNVDEIEKQDAIEFSGEVFKQLTEFEKNNIYISTIEFVEAEECEEECEDVDDQVFPIIGFYLFLSFSRYNDHKDDEYDQHDKSFYYEFKK